MKKLFFLIIASVFPVIVFAAPRTEIVPSNGIGASGWDWYRLLSYAEEFILKVVLPLGLVGVTLYVGYHLLTAEGNEEKMKKAFKSLSFGAIGLIAVACAYAFVSIISRLSF